MAITKCSECGKDVSDKATACPFCGNPLTEQITTVQLTSKKWKKYKLIGTIMFFVGLILFWSGVAGGSGNSWIGGFMWFIGVILLLIGRFGAWWTNR